MDISREILTEIEREKVINIAKDQIAFNALKKYILAVVYKHGVIEKGGDYNGTINYALSLAGPAIDPKGMPRSDEELGQALRALTYATSLVESGFKELSELQSPEKEEDLTQNPAE